MTETLLLQQIRLALGKDPDVVLWRNNVGRLRDETGRVVTYGVGNPGGSDLIGIVRRCDMIKERSRRGEFPLPSTGSTYVKRCTFLALEVKLPGKKPTPEQEKFLRLVNSMGGVGRVVRSVEDALDAVAEAKR